jgi:hypothetical protein
VRKIIVYVAAWFAAGLGAVALASAGVAVVGNQVTGSRPPPLSADEVRSELAADAAPTTAAPDATTSTTVPGADVPPATNASPATSPASLPAASPPATASPPTTNPPVPSEARTYVLTGGTTTLQFDPSGVKVLVASPNAGYSVEIDPTHDNGIRVEFRSDAHRSRVDGWWDDGPRDDVEEED